MKLTSQEIHYMLINDEARLDALVIQLMGELTPKIGLEHKSRAMTIRNFYFVAMQMLKERRRIYEEHEKEAWELTRRDVEAERAEAAKAVNVQQF